MKITKIKTPGNLQSLCCHCVKSVRIPRFSGPYFAVFGLNTEVYRKNLRIRSEYREIWTKNLQIHALYTQCVGVKVIVK